MVNVLYNVCDKLETIQHKLIGFTDKPSAVGGFERQIVWKLVNIANRRNTR